MHYHVVMKDGTVAHQSRIERFEMLDEAETVAQLLSERHIQTSWIPTRYPGRASRLHEVAVYLDRRSMSRRDVLPRERQSVRALTDRPTRHVGRSAPRFSRRRRHSASRPGMR